MASSDEEKPNGVKRRDQEPGGLVAPGSCATAAEVADHGEQRLREIRCILASKRQHKALAADATENEGARPPIMEEDATRLKIKRQERTQQPQEWPAGFALPATNCAARTVASGFSRRHRLPCWPGKVR